MSDPVGRADSKGAETVISRASDPLDATCAEVAQQFRLSILALLPRTSLNLPAVSPLVSGCTVAEDAASSAKAADGSNRIYRSSFYFLFYYARECRGLACFDGASFKIL
jgi:hypothetical protein